MGFLVRALVFSTFWCLLAHPAAAQPTTLGEAIVGFEPGSLPALGVGGSLAGFPIVGIEPRGSFLVVGAAEIGSLRGALRSVPGVAYVEDNALLHALGTPNDARYGEQYGPALMGFPAAWGEVGYGSDDVTVAVLDSGLQKNHPDFESGRILQGHDYVNGDSNPNDDCGHGTHVTGTVAATTNNSLGVAGMSQATILPMKVLSPIGFLINIQCSGSTAGIAQAIFDATDQGARVISMSLGGASGSNALRDSVDYAWGGGVLVVAAAGNDGPCSNCVSYPARYQSVIAVGAVTSSKALASYSSTGPEVEVAAPGSGVLSTYNDSGYRSLSGTSMATPHVSGALALALSCQPAAGAATLRSFLRSTAEDLGTPGFDSSYGYGLARADALVAALGGCSSTPGNHSPTASFTLTKNGLTVSVDASASHDPDGDPLSYAWTFGDGGTGSGMAASHSYAAAGTYTVTLTVSDGKGGSGSASQTVSVSAGNDPDASTPTMQSGQTATIALSGTGAEAHRKIFVPAGKSQLQVVMTGPSCGLLSCPFDADLYVRYGARATDSLWDCRPYRSGNGETCTLSSPASGWWYLRVKSYSGSGSVSVTPTVN